MEITWPKKINFFSIYKKLLYLILKHFFYFTIPTISLTITKLHLIFIKIRKNVRRFSLNKKTS